MPSAESIQNASLPAAAAGTITFGHFTVNRMGYGAMRITGPGIWGPPADRENAKRVLRRALDLGVDFIDTADSYGPNVSEELIAEALYPYPEGLVIATKGGLLRDGPDSWPGDGRPEHLKRACEGSLERLRVERIDLYQFHWPDERVPVEDSVGALVELQQEGKIRDIGVSNFGVERLARARRIAAVVSVQNRYNLAERDSDDVLAVCERDGLAFIPWYPLAASKLSGSRGGSGRRKRATDAIARVAERLGATPSQVALAWLLARSPAMLPIPGTSSVQHLEENVSAAALRLSDSDLAELQGR